MSSMERDMFVNNKISVRSQGGRFTLVIIRALVGLIASVAVVSGDRYHPVEPALRAGPPNEHEKDPKFWREQAEAVIKARLNARDESDGARNVVLFLGDGMSLPTLMAARTYLGQKQGLTGEEAELYFESFPTTGLLKTYCTNSQVGESACTATAYLCGAKTNAGCIGVSAAVARGDCAASNVANNRLRSIAEWALADGLDVGIVTTARVTHASPAGAFAKVAERSWENDALVTLAKRDPATCPDIAYQLIHNDPGRQFKVILGGGRKNFLPETITDEEGAAGKRQDGRNLIKEWKKYKAGRDSAYIWNRKQLMEVNNKLPEYLLGLFESDHMQYHMMSNKSSEPTLAELTETAIRMLSRNESGFFLFVEGGRIDHAHHANRVALALDETVQLSRAVTRAADLLDHSALLLVAADHAHVMSVSGYAARGHHVLAANSQLDANRRKYMTLSYANGPGAREHVNSTRPDVTLEPEFRKPWWRSHAGFYMKSSTHGGDDVGVFARGPRHALFSGLYEQSGLAHRMAWAACIGPGRAACTRMRARAAPSVPAPRSHALLVAASMLGYYMSHSVHS